jgi:hypothetical protein
MRGSVCDGGRGGAGGLGLWIPSKLETRAPGRLGRAWQAHLFLPPPRHLPGSQFVMALQSGGAILRHGALRQGSIPPGVKSRFTGTSASL